MRGYIELHGTGTVGNARSKVRKKDLRQAQEILDTDHYGLERVKDRILEYLRGSKPCQQNRATHPLPGRARRG